MPLMLETGDWGIGQHHLAQDQYPQRIYLLREVDQFLSERTLRPQVHRSEFTDSEQALSFWHL